MRGWLPSLVLVLVIFFLFANHKINQEKSIVDLENGCLIYSLHNKMLIESNERLEPYLWSRIIAIHFYGSLGHAIHVFIYKNRTFVYDPAKGSFCISSYPIYDPLTIAEIVYPNLFIKRAFFIEPTLLLHSLPVRPIMLEWK